jgi:hypothetical protein
MTHTETIGIRKRGDDVKYRERERDGNEKEREREKEKDRKQSHVVATRYINKCGVIHGDSVTELDGHTYTHAG